MRLDAISVLDTPPVKRFEVSDLADVVVLAGPNGVGKTRLLQRIVAYLRGASLDATVRGQVSATSPAEVQTWGQNTLDLSVPADLERLRTTLQASRRRQNWTSSLVNFESDRSIQNLQPLNFTWDMADPVEEAVSWDITFGFMRDRFQDTVHAMFRMIEAQKQSIANRAIQLQREGRAEMKLNFTDPMDPFKEVFAMLLAPKELVNPSARNQRLEYTVDGQVFDFTTLSSGEREVVNIAFDFLLRKPQDCIVFFDEPELHLHPELSYKLLQTLRTIGLRNQFVLSTHSPDVITASLDQSVVFVSPPRDEPSGSPGNQAVPVAETDDTNQALRLLGQSIGIVALGRRIVLVEGEQSSLDKQTYGSIIANRYPGLVLVPSGGKHIIRSFDAVYDRVLSRAIWGVEFFMLCDRDSGPPDSAAKDEAIGTGRLEVLPRYHLENYFLDENVWAEAFALMEPDGSPLRDSIQIRKLLRDLARPFVSYAASLSASHALRVSVGNVDVMPKGCHGRSLDETQNLMAECARAETVRVNAALDEQAVHRIVESSYVALQTSLENDDEQWKALIPGKPLLASFASKAGVTTPRAKSMYLHAARQSEASPFVEVDAIFSRFAA